MGWTSYRATHYNKNGSVNRKAEMDEHWTQREHNGYPELNVLKSRMVGAIYYAAIEEKRNGKVESVFAVVGITSTKWGDGWSNFGYKDMTEKSGPGYYDCPNAILKLLTPTSDEYALEWRKKCEENLQKEKLSDLPIGTRIKFINYAGKERILYKHAPAYQFKRPFWMVEGEDCYYKAKQIPDTWKRLA